jgi:hypothetical protein
MNTATSAAQLPSDLEALMRSLRLPHARAIAADVLATARAQRWDPTAVIKALLAEETAGRARSMLASRRKAAGYPTGKTFDVWRHRRDNPTATSIGQALTQVDLVINGRTRDQSNPRPPGRL